VRSFKPESRQVRRYGALVAAVLVGSAVAAGCSSSGSSTGGSGGSSTSTSSSSSDSANIAAANADVAQYLQPPTSITQTVPLPKTPPTGKSIIFLGISEPTVVETQNTIKAVAGILGWKFSVVPYDNANPASMQQAFATALAKHPTVVAESGVAPSLFGQSTINAYAAAHVPIIVAAATPVTVTNTILGTATGPGTQGLGGKVLADWFVANSKGAGDAIIEHAPGYSILDAFTSQFQSTVQQLCSACKLKLVNISLPQIAAGDTTSIVISALKANPSYKYLIYDNGDFAIGINSALQAAGLTGISVAGYILDTSGAAELKAGNESAWMGYNPYYQAYGIMDIALRYVEGVPITANDDTQPTQVFTPTNIGSTVTFNKPANALQQFEKLWKVPITPCTPAACG
jgi:ribose transport system substrate-binding protein